MPPSRIKHQANMKAGQGDGLPLISGQSHRRVGCPHSRLRTGLHRRRTMSFTAVAAACEQAGVAPRGCLACGQAPWPARPDGVPSQQRPAELRRHAVSAETACCRLSRRLRPLYGPGDRAVPAVTAGALVRLSLHSDALPALYTAKAPSRGTTHAPKAAVLGQGS